MKLPVHAESAQTLARAARAESRGCCCCRAEAPAAAAADPAGDAGAAVIVIVAVPHSLIEL